MIQKIKHIGLVCLSLLIFSCSNSSKKGLTRIDQKVDSLLSIMTLEEKIGQMNQYNGFWNVTGPTPQNGDAANKYKHLESGLVGSMLNVRDRKSVV